MATHRIPRLFVLLSLLYLCSICAAAQSLTGTPRFNSIAGDINEGNLNVHLSFPVFQRNGGISYSLVYDSNFWSPTQYTSNNYWFPNPNNLTYAANTFGWQGPFKTSIATAPVTGFWNVTRTLIYGCGYSWVIVYVDKQGTNHLFPAINCLGAGTYTYNERIDGYLAVVNITISTNANINPTFTIASLHDMSGNTIVAPLNPLTQNEYAGSVTDPNGNVISVSSTGNSVSDPLGTAFTVTHPTNQDEYVYTGGNGAASTIVTYSSVTVTTAFGCSGIQEYSVANGSSPDPVMLPTSIQYYDGSILIQQYTLAYDSYGRIKQVNLPTGGAIQYTYSAVNCTDGTPNSVTKKFAKDGVHFIDGTWTYVRTGSAPATSTTTITATNYDTTIVNFAYYQETLRKVWTGNNTGVTPLLQVIHCYNYNSATSCGNASGPSSQAEAGLSPQALSVLRSFNGSANDLNLTLYGRTDAAGNRLPLPTEVDSYDFGATSSTRKVYTDYGSWNGLWTCAAFPSGSNVLNKPCYIKVTDGSGTQASGTAFQYDFTAGNYGNLLHEYQETTADFGAYLTTNYTYYSNGALNTVQDPNGTTTTYGSMTCNGAFPQTISSSAVTWTTSQTWDCSGGVLTSRTGPNGTNETTTYKYNDPFWRVTDVYAPWKNGSTTLTHTTYINATSFYSYQNVNGTSSQQQSLTDLDGLGRVLVKSTLAVGGPYSSVSYQYDSNGRLSSVSNPCLSANYWTPCSGSGTSYTAYDGLNRPGYITDGGGGYVAYSYYKNDVTQSLYPIPSGETNPKQKHFEYDALGRLSSVCEMTGIAGSGNCPQTYAVNGFLTRYSYDPAGRLLSISQNTQTGGTPQNRSFTYDLMGRMLTEAHPESGTTTYSYAPYAFCWQAGNDGDMHVRTDAAGNVTCYHYDGLHRLIDAAGWKNNTWYPPYHRYRYDSSSNGWLPLPSGVTVSDVVGRMVETETDGASGTITDEWFSYADNGQMTDLYQSSPNSGGYYHSTAAYYENGALSSLSPGITGNQVTLPWNFQLNQYAQPFSQSNSNGTILSSTTYNADGTVATVAHNSGDNEAFSYDNAGRMSKYQFNIGTGPTQVIGNVNWNQNGTLGSLSITDGFVAADTQTCTYGYDDLVRVSSVNCLSGTTNVWNQTFGYDVFGNITKTGSISWACATCYDTTKNQYNSSLSGQISYDGNGNLLNDTFHTYAWDANWQNPSSVDTTNLIYDALGRMVEYQTGTTSKQIMYGPTGIVAVMNGQTEIRAFEPFPAGGVFVHQPGSATNYWRHPDWLGSSRFASTEPGRGKFFDVGYAPFGEDYGDSGTKDLFFTAKEQDVTQTVGGLYDFSFRKYAPRQGRWISPDPAGVAAMELSNPQSLNRYAYVSGGPLATTDPNGMGPCKPPAPCITGWLDMNVYTQSIGLSEWDEFDLMQIPVTTFSYVPPRPLSTPFNDIRNENGEAFSARIYAPGGWLISVVGNGMYLFQRGIEVPGIWTWLTNFAGSFPRIIGNEVREGGCFRQFAEEAFDPASETAGQDAAIKSTAQAGAYTAATAYAAEQGLAVPMRSSIVRGILGAGEVAGETLAIGLTDVEATKAIVHEGISYARGECQ